MNKMYIGIDNGISGNIGIACGAYTSFHKTPTIFGQDYTKAKKNISRIDSPALLKLLTSEIALHTSSKPFCLLERPMVNPQRFASTTSALRALEATLVILETLGIGYRFVDSKEWQKELLPKGVKGSEELKKASNDIGQRLFPQFINIAADFDGLLIAEWARRNNL